ncbi:MAG: DUF2189 domain-containing protein [Pseudomonadota bacterium]
MSETTQLPNVKRVHFSAPFAWLAMGWNDFKTAPFVFGLFGAGLALISIAIAGTLYATGRFSWFLVLAGGFMIIAPIIATGLYRGAQMIEQDKSPAVIDLIRPLMRGRPDQLMLGVALVFLFGLWAEVAYLIYGLSTSAVHRTMLDFFGFMFTPAGLQMALIGTLIGGAIAFLAYAIVVVTAPMLLQEDMDFFIALITSVRSVLANVPAMLLWAVMIVLLTILGIATAFVGLVIIFPWIGLSSWHAYRSLVEPIIIVSTD